MNSAIEREQPGKIASGVMAVVVHLVFFAFLFFGVNWQRRPPEPVVADLWSSLPPITKPQPKLEVVPPPPAPPVVKPEPPAPKPEPKVEVKPAPEPKPTAKPDISVEKEKQEKAKREQAKRDEAKAERKKQEEHEKAEKAEVLKREALEKQKLASLERERVAKEAERTRLEKEQNEAIQKLAQQQAAAQNKELDGFKSKIDAKVRRFVSKAACASVADPEIFVEVRFFPDGNLVGEPVVRKSSGSAACDEAVRKAVVLAQPLELPPPGHPMFRQFVNPTLRFKPND